MRETDSFAAAATFSCDMRCSCGISSPPAGFGCAQRALGKAGSEPARHIAPKQNGIMQLHCVRRTQCRCTLLSEMRLTICVPPRAVRYSWSRSAAARDPKEAWPNGGPPKSGSVRTCAYRGVQGGRTIQSPKIFVKQPRPTLYVLDGTGIPKKCELTVLGPAARAKHAPPAQRGQTSLGQT